MSPLLPTTRPANLLTATVSVPLVRLDRPSGVVLRPLAPFDTLSGQPARRSKIWELADTLHCSIIGTCLSNAELRHVLVRLDVTGAETADDHELHVIGVTLAGRREAGAKLLQRALDKRHASPIKQYARAKDEEALLRLWNESVQSGDIPGAYWALLSHPVATEAVVKKVFRDVHMLSHLVGAANRADIRRLRQLEEENVALNEKLNRQQQQLRDGFTSRDETIRRLNEALIRRVDDGVQRFEADRETETLRSVVAEVNRKLGQETARRERLEQRLNAMSATLKKTETALQMAEADRDAFRRDIELIENHVIRLLEPGTNDEGTLDLCGRTILYVGGRTHQIPQLRALVERAGGRFLHHDGGIEQGSSLLPGLIGRADVLCFPIDCISHDAVATIKRLCRQLEKPYQPLRTASLAALMSSLTMIFQGLETGIAAE
ncbi:MAG: DUF2325 domain-containing protein [Xanthobacteraceae bacterium]